jgi:hypothetical protein
MAHFGRFCISGASFCNITSSPKATVCITDWVGLSGHAAKPDCLFEPTTSQFHSSLLFLEGCGQTGSLRSVGNPRPQGKGRRHRCLWVRGPQFQNGPSQVAETCTVFLDDKDFSQPCFLHPSQSDSISGGRNCFHDLVSGIVPEGVEKLCQSSGPPGHIKLNVL